MVFGKLRLILNRFNSAYLAEIRSAAQALIFAVIMLASRLAAH